MNWFKLSIVSSRRRTAVLRHDFQLFQYAKQIVSIQLFPLLIHQFVKIRINVIDINDNWPIFDAEILQLLANPVQMYEYSIKTTPTGSPVLCHFDTGVCLPGLHATDADSGTHSYFNNVE